MNKKKGLAIWTVYFDTSDFPGKYVARRFILDRPTEHSKVADTIESVREWIAEDSKSFSQQGDVIKLPPGYKDEPTIVEVWL